MRKFFGFFILILVLAGCASMQDKFDSKTNPTDKDVVTIIGTLEPSANQTPTANKISTSTFNACTATSSPTPWPTPDGVTERMFSPNGDYIASVYIHGHNDVDKPVLEITDYEDKLIQKIVNNKSISEYSPRLQITIYGWSADSKTLYYYYKQQPKSENMAFWWTGYDLRSINVENGYDQAVIPEDGAMSFALSPDESKIIYSLASEPAGVIHFLDFESGKNTKIYVDPAPQNFIRIGDFHWSPDGKAIIFQTEADWVDAYKEIGTVYLDAQTFSQKILHRGGIYTYQFNGWEDDQTLRYYADGKGHILVNIETGKERPALTGIKTLTPTITRKPTRTQTPTISLTPTTTRTTVPTMVVMYMQNDPWKNSVSPNGEFIADVYDIYGHGSINKPLIEVFDKNRNLLWQIPYKKEIVQGPEPYVSLNFIRWSLNERELYYCTQFHGTRGDYAVWYDGIDPSKFDLYTGKIQPLFPEGTGTTAFKFTEDGGRVVYSFFGEDADTVYVHNYRTGQTMSAVIDPGTQPYQAIGDFHWSPNEEGIVFQTEAEWLEFENGAIFVEVQTVYLNALTMEQKLIHRDSIYTYELQNWIDNQTIGAYEVGKGMIAVNVFTGEETILPEATREW